MKHLIYRQVALPLRAFDYLKQFQRDHEARHGRRLTNNEALTIILGDHQQANEAREGRDHARSETRS